MAIGRTKKKKRKDIFCRPTAAEEGRARKGEIFSGEEEEKRPSLLPARLDPVHRRTEHKLRRKMTVLAANSPHILLHSELWQRQRWRHPQQLPRGRPASAALGGDAGAADCSSPSSAQTRRGFGSSVDLGGRRRRREVRAGTFWVSKPSSVEMEHIADDEALDLVLRRAQEESQPVVIEWMASWCRKCIYLKPKLEKLAAEFYSKLKFYYVDVNNVPQALVKRGNVTKMPTIQLWKDGEMKEEIIGGHKAWLVVEEVREMILKYI